MTSRTEVTHTGSPVPPLSTTTAVQAAQAGVRRALDAVQAVDDTITALLAQLAAAEEQRSTAQAALVEAVSAVTAAVQDASRQTRAPGTEDRTPSHLTPTPTIDLAPRSEEQSSGAAAPTTSERAREAPSASSAVEPGHTDSPWLKQPETLTSVNAHTVREFVTALDPDDCRLVDLTGVTANELRQLLPHGWCVQPDGAETYPVPAALVYRSITQPPPMDVTLRRAYVLVDALALLDTTRKLSASMYATLEAALPRLRDVETPHHRHIRARAQWRRTVAAPPDAIEDYVGRGAALGPLTVAGWLTVVAGSSLQYSGTYARILETLKSVRTGARHSARPASSAGARRAPALVERRTTLSPPATRPDVQPVVRFRTTPATGSTPIDLVPLGLDLERLAAKRRSTEAARDVLESLDADEAGVSSPPLPAPHTTAAQLQDGLGAAELDLLLRLSVRGQHPLDEVRQWALERGLVPLAALRSINQWAEERITTLGLDFDDAVIEVDDPAGAVWVDDIVKELLP